MKWMKTEAKKKKNHPSEDDATEPQHNYPLLWAACLQIKIVHTWT